MTRWIPFIHDEQSGDEVFGFFGCICKLGLIKVPLTGQDVVQSLVVIITKEWTEPAQTNGERQPVIYSLVFMCVYFCVCLLTACR